MPDMKPDLLKKAFGPADAIQAYNSLPHLPWEQIIPAAPVMTAAAGQVGKQIYGKTLQPVVADTAGYVGQGARKVMRHALALPPMEGIQPYKPLTDLRRLLARFFKMGAARQGGLKLAAIPRSVALGTLASGVGAGSYWAWLQRKKRRLERQVASTIGLESLIPKEGCDLVEHMAFMERMRKGE